VGSSAEVVLPKFNLRNIKVIEGEKVLWENGKFVVGVAGVEGATDKDGAIRIRAGSGRYVFILEGD
jgi:hypothetical protein